MNERELSSETIGFTFEVQIRPIFLGEVQDHSVMSCN